MLEVHIQEQHSLWAAFLTRTQEFSSTVALLLTDLPALVLGGQCLLDSLSQSQIDYDISMS